jgi:hypothetical protein
LPPSSRWRIKEIRPSEMVVTTYVTTGKDTNVIFTTVKTLNFIQITLMALPPHKFAHRYSGIFVCVSVVAISIRFIPRFTKIQMLFGWEYRHPQNTHTPTQGHDAMSLLLHFEVAKYVKNVYGTQPRSCLQQADGIMPACVCVSICLCNPPPPSQQ